MTRLWRKTLRNVSDDSKKKAGFEVGRAAAAAILAARQNDGENRTLQYTPVRSLAIIVRHRQTLRQQP